MDKKIALSTEELTCEICNKIFDRRSRLESHYKTHTGEKPFACPYCQKTFTTRGNCNTHIRVHTRERPYQCNYCDKSFSQNGQLVIHVRRHTGEKPFVCRHCQKGFSCTKVLKIHLRTHTGEKPFSCEFCQKSFAAYANLVVHRRIHTRERPYTCKLCGRGFEHSGNLSRHLRVHKVENGIRCIPCGEVFSEESALMDHTLTAHPNEKEKEDELDVEVPGYNSPPTQNDAGKDGYKPQCEMIPTSVPSNSPSDDSGSARSQRLLMPGMQEESIAEKSPSECFQEGIHQQLHLNDNRADDPSNSNSRESDSGMNVNSPISDCSSDPSTGNADETYTIKSSIPESERQNPLTIKIRLPNQKYRYYHGQYPHPKFKNIKAYLEDNEYSNGHQNSLQRRDEDIVRQTVDQTSNSKNVPSESSLPTISRQRSYASCSDDSENVDTSGERKPETNGDFIADYSRDRIEYDNPPLLLSFNQNANNRIQSTVHSYQLSPSKTYGHAIPLTGLKVRQPDDLQEDPVYGKVKRTTAPPPLIPIPSEKSKENFLPSAKNPQEVTGRFQYPEVSGPYPDIICEAETSSNGDSSPFAEERKEDKKNLFPESSTSEVPLEEIRQNVHTSLMNFAATNQETKSFKCKVEMVIRVLIGESTMAQLGYPSKNIEQILIQILDMAGKSPCADVRVDELRRMKLNVQKFLDYFLPPEALSPEAVIDTLTACIARRTQPQMRTHPPGGGYNGQIPNGLKHIVSNGFKPVVSLPSYVGVEGKNIFLHNREFEKNSNGNY